ncbi:MAG: GatB/YqeY domain-containing protein [Gammaproteobacteria bacterium]|nr:GatB/YqeY domain-containing protein [Gammaproteobacteria bacterium]MBU2056231.1 GatB/YqeY domain-containing protein [Gammaproteobacteria bacterium]MBU2177327.1 GatB/YqeY domain-containing protein [Gammaproteobacteria bacterium]MBU2248807.1 GatB/YqeY domain-containing protein [Gammaproteobacteria bacterium]MBU2345809.1 GatB/YqeY domain-containing protein [Gammaproteobacteria bacterium]
MALLEQLQEAQKDAMRAKDKLRLGTIRLALAEIKQRQIDLQMVPDDTNILPVLTKMVKQRKESASQYSAAGRQDLADIELAEIVIVEQFLPQALSQAELDDLVQHAITAVAASGMQDMAKVMAYLKPQVQGRTDMAVLSQVIKARLS